MGLPALNTTAFPVTPEKILIIEDDQAIADMVKARLEREGFEVHWRANGRLGWEAILALRPSLILLDITMPEMNGVEVCRLVRQGESTRRIPIIMVTANSDDADVTVGLEMGADDYVPKPFSLRQLVARIRAVLRRSVAPVAMDQSEINLGPLKIDCRGHEASIAGRLLNLTKTEFSLLQSMAAEPGRVFTREEHLELMDKEDDAIVKRNIDVHIMTLRRKLGEHGHLIHTVRGIGYKIKL